MGQESAKKVLSVAYVVFQLLEAFASYVLIGQRVFNHYNRVRSNLYNEADAAAAWSERSSDCS